MKKRFLIWLGWHSERHPFIFVLVGWIGLSVLIYSLAYFGLRALIDSIEPGVAVLMAMGAAILSLTLFAVLVTTWGGKKRNWRVAAHRGWKFAEENNLKDHHDLLYVLAKTKETENPAIVNEWIEDYKKWQAIVEKLKQLEKDREELPKRILKLTCQIEVLDNKLFS